VISHEELIDRFYYREDGNLVYRKDIGNRVKQGTVAGYISSRGRTIVMINNKSYYLHRLIYLYHYKELPKYIDHIDNNTYNNKIENLRPCTILENTYNSSVRSDSRTGHKGVGYVKKTNSWRVRVSIDKKRKYIGYFKDFELACLAADQAREKYHGEFANNG